MSLPSWCRPVFLSLALAGAVGVVVVSEPSVARAQTPGLSIVSSSLLRFEGAVTWTSVSPAWRAQRGAWLAAVSNATTAEQLAAQVLALESAMGWSAVQPTWRQLRAPWVGQVRAAHTARDVAQVLLALENTTKWESVAASWRTDRTAWVAALRSVQGQ